MNQNDPTTLLVKSRYWELVARVAASHLEQYAATVEANPEKASLTGVRECLRQAEIEVATLACALDGDVW
ncbi:hypothetical protein [Serinicoccus marinus]|uniref:hypothetical protein n=1 Tax=Serinicoccus marinus TaxID=247333 RepID=UPI00122E95CA|nr:hypothetical protein [Serinicoccus marinus]